MAVLFQGLGTSTQVSDTRVSMPEGHLNWCRYAEPITAKTYIEWEHVAGTTSAAIMVGLANENAPYDWVTRPNDDYILYLANSQFFGTGSPLSTTSSMSAYLLRSGIAIDPATKKFWLRKSDSSWLDGDPATDTGGYTYTGTATDIYFVVGNGGAGSGTKEIELYTDTTMTPPTGFSDIQGTTNTPSSVILALSPVAYWKLNDAYNAAVVDYSGSGYDGSWVGVTSGEVTQDDMIGDGVLGLKVSNTTSDTGYMQNTAIMAAGDADTGNYTYIGWVKGYGDTDVDVMSWYTTMSAGTKEYRGLLTINLIGEITWQRIYQTGVDPINDVAYQYATTSGLGLVPEVPYLIALRESATLTEILVNGSVVLSLPRVGMSVNDTTYAPREGLRVGNETIMSVDQTYASYVHSAVFDSNLTDAVILTIYNSFSATDKSGDMVTVQSGQTGSGIATKTGTLTTTGTLYSYQEDAFLVDTFGVVTEFISQSASATAVYVSPEKYITSNQIPQGTRIAAVSTGDPQTYRFSTGGITTTPTSTPANTPIAPRLINAGNYKSEINIRDAGVVTPSFGQVVLDNSDGGLDGLVDKAFDGSSYKLYYGPKGGVFPDDFTKVVDTVMGKPTFDHNTVKIQLKDKMDFLSLPLISGSFSGTGNAQGDTTVKGSPKNRVIGRVWSAPVKLLNATKLVYWVCDDEMATDNQTNNYNSYLTNPYRSIPNEWNNAYASTAYGRVFDGGTQITNGANYASEADLFAIQPAAGTVKWYRPQGFSGPIMFRLGSVPDKDVRVDVETTPSGSANWAISDIISERPEITISSSSTDVSIVRGFMVDDTSFTYADAIREFMKRDYYFARFDRNGEFKVSQVAVPRPSGTSLYEFNESNMASISIDQLLPAWKLFINTGETTGSQVNTGISESRRNEFTQSGYHTMYTFEEPATRSRHKLSEILSVNVKSWWNQADIDAHSDLTRVYLMEDRVMVNISLDSGHLNSDTLLLDIGDLVTVKMPRYNFDLGKKMIVHGVRHDYGSGKLNFTLWG